ncbi:hypothetical protein SAMN05216294_1922 [Flagellimonas zhangzhouensis]|nr:hypothetical protein SAMN05216294_1922 [Allomuricauda zhangzhouensis]
MFAFQICISKKQFYLYTITQGVSVRAEIKPGSTLLRT